MKCDQCSATMINGVFCHESGCPNSRKTWVPDREQWVLFVKCHECGCDVEAGESCDCQQPMEENAEALATEEDNERHLEWLQGYGE